MSAAYGLVGRTGLVGEALQLRHVARVVLPQVGGEVREVVREAPAATVQHLGPALQQAPLLAVVLEDVLVDRGAVQVLVLQHAVAVLQVHVADLIGAEGGQSQRTDSEIRKLN